MLDNKCAKKAIWFERQSNVWVRFREIMFLCSNLLHVMMSTHCIGLSAPISCKLPAHCFSYAAATIKTGTSTQIYLKAVNSSQFLLHTNFTRFSEARLPASSCTSWSRVKVQISWCLKAERSAGRMPQDEMSVVFMSCCWTRGADLTRQRRWIIMEPVQEHVKCEWECDNTLDSSGVPCQGLRTDRDG